MTRRSSVVIVVALAMSLLVASPASADPPTSEDFAFFGNFHDPVTGTLVLANISRDSLCGWVAGGAIGPPPVYELTTFTDVATGQGAVVQRFSATWVLEAWHLPDGRTSDQEICDGTANQAGPWATGVGHIVGTDNDFFVSGTRRNVFGFTITGSLVDDTGTTYRFLRVNRAQITQDFEFVQLVAVISVR